MARAHAVAAVIKQAADQQTLGFAPFGLMVVDLVIQLGLDGREEVLIENGRLLAFEDFVLEDDFAEVRQRLRPPLRIRDRTEISQKFVKHPTAGFVICPVPAKY